MSFLQNHPKIVSQPANTLGRDFIVGDLHGCRSLLEDLLAEVTFDGARDRLFSVGDLVDRGPDSEGCLELLKEPWFYPVLGNHDAMLIAWIYGGRGGSRCRMYERAFVHNEGWKWANRFSRAREFLPLLEAMPLVRVIGQGEGRFHVVHAGLAGSSDWTDAGLDGLAEDPSWEVERFIPGFDDYGDGIDAALWGRALRQDPVFQDAESEMPGLSRTYVGHTITVLRENLLLRLLSHVFLDTGAYKSEDNPRCGLTLWSHTDNRGWKRTASTIQRID